MVVYFDVIGRCGFIFLNILELLERKRERIDMFRLMKRYYKIFDWKVRGFFVVGLFVIEIGI